MKQAKEKTPRKPSVKIQCPYCGRPFVGIKAHLSKCVQYASHQFPFPSMEQYRRPLGPPILYNEPMPPVPVAEPLAPKKRGRKPKVVAPPSPLSEEVPYF